MIKLEWWDGKCMKSRKFANRFNAEFWAASQNIYNYTVMSTGVDNPRSRA